jgi:hypothetical protein
MFDKRVEHFLSAVKITGVNAIVEDIDRLLIAAGSYYTRLFDHRLAIYKPA